MKTFEKYYEYIKNSFSMYENIIVDIKVKTDDLLIVNIHTNYNSSHIKNINMFIKFDQDTIAFFGDFIPDEFVDEFDNTWQKYSEKEILEILDKKIAEYKNIFNCNAPQNLVLENIKLLNWIV